MAALLASYYEGLAELEDDPSVEIEPVRVTIEGGDGSPDAPFRATVAAWDPFAAHGPVTLRARVRLLSCESDAGQGLFFELSPQPGGHPVWEEMAAVRRGTGC